MCRALTSDLSGCDDASVSENTTSGAQAESSRLAERLKALLAEGAERSKELSSGGSLTGVLRAINGASRQDLELVALFAITGFVQEEAHESTASRVEAQGAFDEWIEGGGMDLSDLENFPPARRARPRGEEQAAPQEVAVRPAQKCTRVHSR
jgi:hypothetical protein